jgi:hypothetical protein
MENLSIDMNIMLDWNLNKYGAILCSTVDYKSRSPLCNVLDFPVTSFS